MLKANGISKKLLDRVLFEKIDFELKEKELIFIQGKSGSGKSLFLKCLTLLSPLDGGRVTFDNQEITDVLNFRSSVHYLRQDFSPTLSNVEEVFNEAFSLNV